jgi:predicted XRE-type DNA-binding protein
MRALRSLSDSSVMDESLPQALIHGGLTLLIRCGLDGVMSRTRLLLETLAFSQPRFGGLLGVAQSHVSRLANGAAESPQTARLLDILERDIASGVDVTAEGYRIGFPAEAGEGLTGSADMPAPDAPPGGEGP